jgi:hypothetical protein
MSTARCSQEKTAPKQNVRRPGLYVGLSIRGQKNQYFIMPQGHWESEQASTRLHTWQLPLILCSCIDVKMNQCVLFLFSSIQKDPSNKFEPSLPDCVTLLSSFGHKVTIITYIVIWNWRGNSTAAARNIGADGAAGIAPLAASADDLHSMTAVYEGRKTPRCKVGSPNTSRA